MLLQNQIIHCSQRFNIHSFSNNVLFSSLFPKTSASGASVRITKNHLFSDPFITYTDNPLERKYHDQSAKNRFPCQIKRLLQKSPFSDRQLFFPLVASGTFPVARISQLLTYLQSTDTKTTSLQFKLKV